MGIPHLVRTLVQKYPSVIQTAQAATSPVVHNLHLDYNGMIHNCAARALKDLKGKPAVGEDDMEQRIFRVTLAYTRHVVRVGNPQRMLFISIDGPGSLAKISQQRGAAVQVCEVDRILRRDF